MVNLKRVIVYALLIIGGCFANADRHTYTAGQWDKSVVKRCVQNTTVIFVSLGDKGYMGSGVVIKKNGLTLTAAHLFQHTPIKEIRMLSVDGSMRTVKIVQIDPQKDLALVIPEATSEFSSVARIQTSNSIWVGQDVLIVGHPREIFWTVTSGIICGFTYHPSALCHSFITDATVNPGNSGGPAFNSKGEVIGIVSAGYINMFGQSIGLNLIISVKEIHKFMKLYEESSDKFVPIKRYKLGEIRELAINQ